MESLKNPYDIFKESRAWIQFEFDLGRGSMYGLKHHVRRCHLLKALDEDDKTSQAVKDALGYLIAGYRE